MVCVCVCVCVCARACVGDLKIISGMLKSTLCMILMQTELIKAADVVKEVINLTSRRLQALEQIEELLLQLFTFQIVF